MSFIGLLGLLLSMCALPFAFPGRVKNRYFIAALLVAVHLGTTLVYYSYVQSNDADTALYYFDRYGFAQHSTTFGTILLIQIVQFLKHSAGGSYLDYFMLFQSFGLLGIIILSRTIHELGLPSRVAYVTSADALLFLPSMHFWTSAIGKDAPLFLGTSLAAWSVLRLSSRWPAFAAGILLMTLFRPHIAFIAVATLMLSLFFESRYDILPRFAFLAVAIVASIFVVNAVSSSMNVNVMDPNSVSDFLATQQSVSTTVAGNTSVHGSFIVRLFSEMFRPFFYDAHGIFGIISSIENILFVVCFIEMIINFRVIRRSFFRSIAVKYYVIFTVITTLSLAEVYYNVGLGLRERVMTYPSLLPLFLFGLAARSVRNAHVPSATPMNAPTFQPTNEQRISGQ